uniref:Uncharacterized protein n=1 Tax=Monodon monoceros TaxID=40151 RepID=A0A8C6F5G7_MONMO
MLSEYLVRHLFSTWLCLSVRDSAGSGTICPAKAICTKLEPTLDPEVLELLMESSGHISHRVVEMHFRAAVVGSRFRGLSPLQWPSRDPFPHCLGGSKRTQGRTRMGTTRKGSPGGGHNTSKGTEARNSIGFPKEHQTRHSGR